jgi:ATP-binding cassette, subfamily B, bacterial
MNSDSSLQAFDQKPKTKIALWWHNFKETLRVFAGTPRVIKLVWTSHPGLTVLLFVLNLILGLTPLAELWITKLLVDSVAAFLRAPSATHVEAKYVFGLLAVMALIRILSNSIEPSVRLVQEHLGDFLVRDINLLILKKSNSLVDISVFENPTFHDKLQRAQNEASYRPLSILTNITSILRSSIGLISMVLVLVAFQPLLALVVMSLSLPHLIMQFKMEYESWAIQNHDIPEVRRMRYFSQVLTDKTDANEVRLFNLGSFFMDKYVEKFDQFQERHARLRWSHWRTNCILANVSAVGLVGAYAYIMLRALANTISLGSLTLYMSATTQIEYGLNTIIWAIAQLYQGNLFINNMFEFLEIPLPIVLAPADKAHFVSGNLRQGITFEHVSFRYPDSERNVLEDVNFTLVPGQSIALVGENGAGKTTLVKLLSRLYEPTSGRILVDGIDLKDYDLDSWRATISVIFQSYSRFHMTAKENIGIGQVSVIEDLCAIQAAAERGSAAPVIDRLPDKYETLLGRYFSSYDKGSELSGGEWQKIGLSRAFMRAAGRNGNINGGDHSGDESASTLSAINRDAQLLILDEPTAALDAQAEYDVYLRFHELTKGKMTFLISHRFSTVRMADVVLVLEKGKIIEQGSHEELMAQTNSEYARLYNLQADRYK